VEGATLPAPPPSHSLPLPSWFARTCAFLGVTDPNAIVTFSHSAGGVTVKLSSGEEYCLSKDRL
jgi:hypothetical protein